MSAQLQKTSYGFILFFSLILSGNIVFAQKFQKAQTIPEGKGVVYIYRPWHTVGALVYYPVKVNKENVSKGHHLRNGKYLLHFADPGMNTFWVGDGSKMRVEIEVQEGEAYYIKGTCCKLRAVSESEANKKIIKCKLSTW